MSETKQTSTSEGRAGRRWLWIGTGAVAGLAMLTAWAVPRAFASRAFGAHGGRDGHGFGAGMMHDPAAAKRHAGMALEWLLRGVSASEEQRQQARGIGERLIDEVAPSLERHHAHREAIARELAKPQIDRDAIERLRRAEIALADEASAKVTKAVADLAELLTPEQRVEILDLVRSFHGEAPPATE